MVNNGKCMLYECNMELERRRRSKKSDGRTVESE